jgi:hypothetical protein
MCQKKVFDALKIYLRKYQESDRTPVEKSRSP